MTRFFKEVEAELIETIIEPPRNPTRNLNTINDVDCYEVRWMINNSEAKGDQNGHIHKEPMDFRLLLVKFWLKVLSLANGCQSWFFC